MLWVLITVPLGWSSSLSNDLDKQVSEELRKGDLVGAAVAVIENGQVTFMKAYGVRKKGNQAPVDLDTVFQLGSLSKPISASLVGILQKKKLLNINTPKIRQILSHTTGYKKAGWNAMIESGWSRSRLMQKLSQTEHAEPGTIFDYHNTAFSQIEDVVQSATKMPFQTSLQRYLLDPVEMTRTTVGFSKFSRQENRAWPHARTKYSQNYHNTVMSAGGMNSDIRDMAKFLQLQLGQFPKVATKSDLAPLWEPVTHAADAVSWFRKIKHKDLKSSYGYGWRIADIDGERIVFHGGWIGGFINFMAFSPERQIGIVILTNTETSFGFKTAMRFLL